MAQQPATRLQLSARRFHVRRMEHALVRRDVAMVDDPLRGQRAALVVGSVLAVIAVAGCAVFAHLTPRGAVGSAPIVMERVSGALYVRVGDTLHPVPNLASARLIARTPVAPVPVSAEAIIGSKRGALMGIPGAPAVIGVPVGAQSWTVCDDDRTVVIAGDSGVDRLDPARTVLVTPRDESAAITYLLYDGHRARVDLRDGAVVRALRLDGVVPVPVSKVLLDMVPEVPPITPPVIEEAGMPGPPALPGIAVGTVVRVLGAATAEHYVVLEGGVQPVGEVAADVIRYVYDRRPDEVPTVAPATIAAVPVVTTLPVAGFPFRARVPVGAAGQVVVCAQWHPGGTGATTNTVVLSGKSTDLDDQALITLAQSDDSGPSVDAVAITPGRSAYVRSARVLGGDPTGPRFIVTDAGVVYGIRDDDTATSLGLPEAPELAPWPVLAHLPHGPELSTEAASVLRDGIAAPA